jgi:acyl dehydratase
VEGGCPTLIRMTTDHPGTDQGTALQIGVTAQRSRAVTARDIELFTELTGDRNPIHHDREIAAAAASSPASGTTSP